MVSVIRDKRMMLELLKLKLEQLPFDIAVVKNIAIEQSNKDVEALQRGKESIPVDLLLKSRPCKKPKLKKEAKPSKKKVINLATAASEIMIMKVVFSKRKNVTTVTRPAIL